MQETSRKNSNNPGANMALALNEGSWNRYNLFWNSGNLDFKCLLKNYAIPKGRNCLPVTRTCNLAKANGRKKASDLKAPMQTWNSACASLDFARESILNSRLQPLMQKHDKKPKKSCPVQEMHNILSYVAKMLTLWAWAHPEFPKCFQRPAWSLCLCAKIIQTFGCAGCAVVCGL